MEFHTLNRLADFNGYNPVHKLSSFSDIILKHISIKEKDSNSQLSASLNLKKTQNSVKFEIVVSNDVIFDFNTFMKEVGIVPKRFEKRKTSSNLSKTIQYRNKEENPDLYKSAIDDSILYYEILKEDFSILNSSEIVVSEGSENPRPEQICYCSEEDASWCTCEGEWDEYERFNNTVVMVEYPTTTFILKYDRKKWFEKFN